jgi:hypothetical protein
MLDDWVEREGNIVWDEKVTSADDKDLKAGDKYIDKSFVGKDQNGKVFSFNDDGTVRESEAVIGEGKLVDIVSNIIEPERKNDVGEVCNIAIFALLADNVTGGGVVDDIAIPIVKLAGLIGNQFESDAVYEFAKNKKPGTYFRGGTKKARDGTYLESKGNDFKNWFHRDYHNSKTGNATLREIDEAYQYWKSIGSPTVK